MTCFYQVDTENPVKSKTKLDIGTKRSQPMCDVTNKKLRDSWFQNSNGQCCWVCQVHGLFTICRLPSSDTIIYREYWQIVLQRLYFLRTHILSSTCMVSYMKPVIYGLKASCTCVNKDSNLVRKLNQYVQYMYCLESVPICQVVTMLSLMNTLYIYTFNFVKLSTVI